MPKIYTKEKREEIKEQLMDAGLDLIKQSGMKKMSIETITKKVGIAQGTFYNFFNSKEILIYNIATRYKDKVNADVENIIKTKGYLDRADIYKLYYSMILEDEDNIYRYLKRDDVQILLTRLPKDYFNKITDVKAEIEHNLIYVKEKKKDYDLDVVINWIQLMNLTVENKDILIDTKIEKIIHTIIENMLDEIF